MSDNMRGKRYGITIERDEQPLAPFYQRAQHWLDRAICVGADPDTWFEGTERYDKVEAREHCANCPVRIECGTDAMEEEGESSEEFRAGIRAWMTPAQRASLSRRGGLKGRDPMKLVQGHDGRRRVPPIPDEGDKWTRHHTTLARKLMKWVGDNVEVGAKLPTKATLMRKMECKVTPLDRVLTELVQDGLLDVEKGAKVAYVRRRGARAIGEWVPAHLR